jgi:hypothetical protein
VHLFTLAPSAPQASERSIYVMRVTSSLPALSRLSLFKRKPERAMTVGMTLRL